MIEEKYLTIANAAVGLKKMAVLEVGGCVPPELLNYFSPKSWNSIDINTKRVENVKNALVPFAHHAEIMDARKMDFPDDTFDRIYSINCFEHINGMDSALSEMYRVLKPGGLLFTIFGPIWSSPVGHHTYIETPDGVIHFNENVLPDWAHLLNTESSFMESIKGEYSDDICDQITSYIYQSDDLNRLIDSDYYRLIGNSGFRKILVMKNKKGRKLTHAELSLLNEKGIDEPRTTELMLILRKGRFSTLVFLKSIFKLMIYKLIQGVQRHQ